MLAITIVVFIAILLALVLVHEFGHFITAKWAGCRVEEFGFGFPPRLFSIKRGVTTYSFNLLPLGGFVKIEGEDSIALPDGQPAPATSFAGKPALWRVIILAAGVTMNVLLAVVLLGVQAGLGVPTAVTDTNAPQLTNIMTYIIDVAPGSPAAAAGIVALDRVVSIGSVSNPSLEKVQEIVRQQTGSSVAIEIERAGQHKLLNITPRVNPPEGEGALGVNLAETGLQRVPWWKAPWAGAKRAADMLVAIISQFGIVLQRLFSHGQVGETLTGPIGIAIYTKEATILGASYVLEFAALISLNLALINILPFPALDGGRILFVALEKILGRRLPGKIEQMTHTIGFALLIVLMILITLRDMRRFF